MMLKIFSVYDSKVGAYLPPIFFRSNAEALRAFSSAATKTDHDFHRYAADYTLFELGSFHDESAKVTMLNTPKSLAVAIEFLHNDSQVPAPLEQVV